MRCDRDFETCETELRKMLIDHGHLNEIVWTFAEDYAWIDQILYVNFRNVAGNRELIKLIYDDNGKYSYGIELSLVATCEEFSMCSVFVPHSERDAELKMIAGVKVTIPLKLPCCRVIFDSANWEKMVSRNRRKSQLVYSPVADLMCKSDIEDRWIG